jgi:hypothetical protein
MDGERLNNEGTRENSEGETNVNGETSEGIFI